MTKIASSTTAAQIRYMKQIIAALRAMSGSGKAAAVKEWIANTLTAQGKTIPDTILSSGASKFANDIQWARMYLVNAGMLETKEAAGRGFWKLTPAGWEVPLDPESITGLYDSAFQKGTTASSDTQEAPEENDPQGQLAGIQTWESELVNLLTNMPDKGFERLCAFIMTQNGVEAKVTGQTGDGGVDGEGLFPVDRYALVKMRIAWQCKRFKDGNVGSKDIRDFRGAIDGRAQYGLFFTTSGFTLNAISEAARAGAIPIELVDLRSLINLMGANGIGLKKKNNESDELQSDASFFDEYMNPKGQSSGHQLSLN